MKYIFLIATILFSTPLLADSTFLSGLNFTNVYAENGNYQYELIGEKGISVANFLKKINDTNTSLGEKVALLNGLSSYYEWAEKPKGNFNEFQNAYTNCVKEMYHHEASPLNEVLKPEVRLLLQLMKDFDSSSPHVEIYQKLAEKLPNSLTAQTVAVYAFAYDILYNDKNDFATIQELKNNYLKPYYDNIELFETDVPIEIKALCVDDILPYTLNCEDRLKCFVDTSTEQSTIIGLNELSNSIKEKILSETTISEMYSSEWTHSKLEALEWINLQEKNIEKIKTSALQKALIRHCFVNKLYELMHNIDKLSVHFLDSSLMKELNTLKSKCKNDANCAGNAYLKKIETDLNSISITKKEIENSIVAKNNFQTIFNDSSNNIGLDAVSGSGDDENIYQFESNFDLLHFLMFYFYIHPDKITEMYNLN